MKVTAIQRRLIQIGLQKKLEEWIEQQPEPIQSLAREFPLGTTVVFEDRLMHLIGYMNGDRLLLTQHDPAIDYESAVDDHIEICADHLREVLKTEPVVVSQASERIQ